MRSEERTRGRAVEDYLKGLVRRDLVSGRLYVSRQGEFRLRPERRLAGYGRMLARFGVNRGNLKEWAGGGPADWQRAKGRITLDGTVRGDTIPPARREVRGRQVWSTMPAGAFYVGDRRGQRVIFAGPGLGAGYMVLYRLVGPAGVLSSGSHRLKSPLCPLRPTLSMAMQDLWRWVKAKQRAGMEIVEGEVD